MRTQPTRWIAGVCGCVAAFASLTLAARAQESAVAEAKPIAVVAIASFDELLQDADYLGGLMGQKPSEMIEGHLQGAPGLDRTKPMGVLATQYGLPPVFAVCVPVTDFSAFIGGLQRLGIVSDDAGNGVMQLSVMGQMLFAKEAAGWALISLAPPMLDGMPADPSAYFAPLTQEHDVAIQVNVQNIPAEIRQQWTDFMGAAARMGVEKGDDESDEDYAARQATLEAGIDQQTRMINEFNQLTVGLAVDRAGQRALLDIAYTAVAGSEFAAELGAYKDAKTNFAGFAQEGAAATMSYTVDTSTMDEAEIAGTIDGVRQQADQAVAEEGSIKTDEARATLKAAMGDFIDALQSTLQAGGLDGGAVLNISPDSFSIVAGGAVGDPSKVEAGFKKLAELAKSENLDMPEVAWEAQSYQDVKFHVMSKAPNENTPPSAKAMLGDKLEMAVGIGEKSVYFALGKNWLDAVKKVVDDSAANPGKPTLPMQLTVSATPIVNAIEAGAKLDGKDHEAAVAGMVTAALSQSEGRDHARIVAEPIENGVRTRFELESGAIQAIATAAMASQMPAAQPPQ